MMISSPKLRRTVLAVLACMFFLLPGRGAQTAEARRQFDIAAGPALTTLKQFTAQSGEQLLYSADAVQNLVTKAVKGAYTPRAALDQMVSGTNVTVVADKTNGALSLLRTPGPNAPRVEPEASSLRPPRRSDDREETIVLSPFEVQPDGDAGYQAANTTSGSRLNSRLKDTPAAVSPFTKEFLSDIGATDLESMLAYATNVEREVEDSLGFQNPPGRDSTGGDFRFRVRGIAGSSSVDYAQSAVPVDLYNIERAEVASGPNSILFGLGAPGGTVALSSKSANLKRTHTSTKAVFGSWDFARFELDHNQVLRRRELGFRLLGLYQDTQGWRYWDLNEQRRIAGAVTYQPIAHTTFRASYQAGQAVNNTTLPWNAADSLTTWLAAGRPTTNTTAVATTAGYGATDRYALLSPEQTVVNFRAKFRSASVTGNPLVTPDLMGYAYSLTGPGGLRTQNFIDYQAKVEHRFSKTLVAELAAYHNVNRILTHGNTAGNLFLTGDPNLNLQTVSGTSFANPHARQLYLEDTWGRDRFKDANDILRLSAAWEVDLGGWRGRHRIAGLGEIARDDRLRRWQNEILVDQNNLAFVNAANPDAGTNQPYRRQYVTEGDFRTYYAGNPTQPMPEFTVGTSTVHSAFATRTRSNTHTIQDARALMFASQSYWWHDRLVTTLGYRVDAIRFDNYGQSRISDGKDPRYTSRQYVLNEWALDGTMQTTRFRPTTFTFGAVAHVTSRLSAFYNQSKNSGTPRLDRTVLPGGSTPPPSEGAGRDYGLMLDVLGDDRLFFRFGAYETKQIKDAVMIPNGVAVDTSTTLGGTAIVNIYNALLTAGKITQSQFDSDVVRYNAGMIDAVTKGWEAEFVANPTKTVTLRLGVSHTARSRANVCDEIYDYFAENEPKWRAAAGNDAALLATINSELATAHTNLDAWVQGQKNPFATRPYRASFTGRYSPAEGRLKGAFVGGGARYQSRNLAQISTINGREIWGTPTLFADAFAGYRFKLPGSKLPLSAQVNVRNMFNSYLTGLGRLNATETGIFRIYLNEPRNYRFTLTAEY